VAAQLVASRAVLSSTELVSGSYHCGRRDGGGRIAGYGHGQVNKILQCFFPKKIYDNSFSV
jgi:hypothetical protein